MAGKMAAFAGLHLQAKVARTEAGVGGFEIDDRQRKNLVGDQVIGDLRRGR